MQASVSSSVGSLLLLSTLTCACSAPAHKPAAPVVAPAARATAPPARVDSGGPASLAGPADQGRIVLYANDTSYATIDYQLGADGSYQATSTVDFAGQKVITKIGVSVDTGGRWSKIAAEGPAGPVSIERTDAKVRVSAKGEATELTLPAGTFLYENFSPPLLTRLVAAYDRKQGGEQTFTLYPVGAAQTIEAKLSFQDQITRSHGAKELTLRRFHLELHGVVMVLYVDAAGQFIAEAVPQQHAAFVRDGHESVLEEPRADDGKLSPASFEVVVDHDVKAKMRDGVELSADVYHPAPVGKYPVILSRTPYKKELAELQARYFARRGYVFVVQDVRGRFGSGGTWEPFVNERKDGFDSVEWAAAQPWSTGKVGMIGASYLGWVQWWAAVEKPPHLVTIIPNVTPPDPFFNIPYEYGVFFLYGAVWWADVLTQNATADISGAAMARIGEHKWSKVLRALPVRDLDTVVLGGENKYWRAWIDHPNNDAYWKRGSYLGDLKNVDIPVFHQSGWFDGDAIGTKLAFLGMARLKKKRQKLVLGPWAHTDQAQRRLGDWDFGPEAVAIDLQREYLRWFDHWLKGVANGIDEEPLVRIFAMGSNRWLSGNTYPLEGTRDEKWFLASGGHANTSKGDGQLVPAAPAADTPDSYVYDPGDPTPDADFYEAADPKPGETVSAAVEKRARDDYHTSVTATRPDMLVYASAPFAADVTYAGPVSAVLYAASSARDTDWFMSLIEVDEAGKLFPLASGKIRARFRDSMSKPSLLRPGQIHAYQLDLWHTGITVKKGHRLRVEVFSADFPIYSRNLNTGGDNLKDSNFVSATQTVHHGGKYASYLLLPRVADDKLK